MNGVVLERFQVEPSPNDIDVKKVVNILKEIKALKDDFPHVKLSTRSNYEEIIISNIKELTDHSIQLKLDVISGWRVIEHKLPINSAFETSFESKTNLQYIVRTYVLMLENLQSFYTSIQMLDEICIIGEPEVITSKTNWRIVKYSSNLFIKIEFVNPFCLEEVSITFHGNACLVKEMTEIYTSRCDDFETETIYNKLLKIFDIPYFPATDEEDIACSICLSYRCDNNRCPIIYCDNEKCEATYHLSCLEKYLKVQRKHVVLTVCIGECPFCKQTLSNSYAPFFHNILAT